MNQIIRYSKIISVTALCFLILGCSGYRKYELSAGTSPIQVGDVVKIQTTDGIELLGSIDSVNEWGLELDGQQIDSAKVKSVQVRELLWAPTVVIGAASVFTVFLFWSEPGNFVAD